MYLNNYNCSSTFNQSIYVYMELILLKLNEAAGSLFSVNQKESAEHKGSCTLPSLLAGAAVLRQPHPNDSNTPPNAAYV